MVKCVILFALLFYICNICKAAEQLQAVKFDKLTKEEETYDFSVRILKKSSKYCGLKKYDEADIHIRTFAPGMGVLPSEDQESEFAAQTFRVGKHNVPPINKGLIGMCIGELRRIGVRLKGMDSKIFYEIVLDNYRRHPRNQVKPGEKEEKVEVTKGKEKIESWDEYKEEDEYEYEDEDSEGEEL